MFRTQLKSIYPETNRNRSWVNESISHLRELAAQGQFQELQEAILTRRRFPQASQLENQAQKAYADLAKRGNEITDAFSRLEHDSIPDQVRPIIKTHGLFRKVVPYEPGFSVLVG